MESAHLSAISIKKVENSSCHLRALTANRGDLSCLFWLSCQNATIHASLCILQCVWSLVEWAFETFELVCRQKFTLWSFVAWHTDCMANTKDPTNKTKIVRKKCGKKSIYNIKHCTFLTLGWRAHVLCSKKLSILRWQLKPLETTGDHEEIGQRLCAVESANRMIWISKM